ncbi:MAG: hypothetical protein IIZ67_01820 [Bacilli bacterium]|nr:hypothetical protein [Bacilli bacterium]
MDEKEEEFAVSLEDLKKTSDEIKRKLEEQKANYKSVEERFKDLPEDFFQGRPNPIDESPEDEIIEDISDEQFDCVMMELMYLKRFDREPEDDNSDLYPRDWFTNPDYKKQFEILAEAVAENKKIVETKGYNEFRKGKYTR